MLDVTIRTKRDDVHFYVFSKDEADSFDEEVRRSFMLLDTSYRREIVLSRRLTVDELLWAIGLHGSWDYAVPQDWWNEQKKRHDQSPLGYGHPKEYIWWYPDKTIKPDASVFGEPYYIEWAQSELCRLITQWAIGEAPPHVTMLRTTRAEQWQYLD